MQDYKKLTSMLSGVGGIRREPKQSNQINRKNQTKHPPCCGTHILNVFLASAYAALLLIPTYVALQRIREGRQAVLQLIAEGGGRDPAAIGSAAACGLSPPVAVAVAVAVPADVPVAYCV